MMEPTDLERQKNDKEVLMSSNLRDYSVFDKFNFERKPVGVKFVITKPEGIERLGKGINFCEMLKEAQVGNPFYVGEGDFLCVEPMVLGMEDPEPVLVSGLLGGLSGLFKEARANRKLYQYLPKMPKGSVKYVAFSPIDQLTFDPDVMVITATVSQAQTILRSVGYSTGDYFSSKATPVVSCAWMYVYPVLSGEMNFTVTGLALGMQALSVFPPGLFLISVPWNLLPTMMENLEEMLAAPTLPPPTPDEHRKRFKQTLEDLRKMIEE
jgi:uncharacterized protein (DUF169 family)